MISGSNLYIYKALSNQKAITEKYIGSTKFNWYYTEAYYTAECTVSIPFDLFDKTIVGILQVDDVLSLEQIGDILGMNVIDKPNEQQYLDKAEYEILRVALDNLKRYGMLDTGDIHYSSCRLTSIGKEYAQKGRKFKVESRKPFALFYDHISHNHVRAKPIFTRLKGYRTGGLQKDFEYHDETLMKQIASEQTPEIYNFDTGNSFTDPRLDQLKSHTFCLELDIALLYDLQQKSINFIAYEPITKSIEEYFSKWLNEHHREEIINKFLQEAEFIIGSTPFPVDYIELLSKNQESFLSLLDAEPERALLAAKESNTRHQLIDIEYFWNNLSEFVSNKGREVWFFIPDATKEMLSIIEQVLDDSIIQEQFYIFIAINKKDYHKNIQDRIQYLLEQANKIETKVFLVEADFKKIKGFKFWAVKSNILELEETHHALSINGEPFTLSSLRKSTKEINDSHYASFKNHFAGIYLTKIQEEITRYCSDEVTPSKVTKALIESHLDLDRKAQVFNDLHSKMEVQQQTRLIEQVKSGFIERLREIHQVKLTEQLEVYLEKFRTKVFSNLDEINDFLKKVDQLESEYLQEYKILISKSTDLRAQIHQEEKRIREEQLAKTYIIDTNIFIEDPDVVSKIDKKHNVVLSHTVIDELDKLKQREGLIEKASKALFILNKQLGKTKNLKTAKANTKLLSEDYQKQSADNRILSVAFMYNAKNPVLLTNDNGLQLKAKSISIPAISLKEFINGTALLDEVPASLPKIDYKKIIRNIRPNKNGLYPVGVFMSLLRKQVPNFDYQTLGFSKAYEFVESLNQFDVIDKQFIKVKTKIK